METKLVSKRMFLFFYDLTYFTVQPMPVNYPDYAMDMPPLSASFHSHDLSNSAFAFEQANAIVVLTQEVQSLKNTILELSNMVRNVVTVLQPNVAGIDKMNAIISAPPPQSKLHEQTTELYYATPI